MISRFRQSIKAILLLLWTFCIFSIFLFGLLFTFWCFSIEKRFSYLIRQLWANGTVKILGVLLKIDGKPPKTPYFLISNHLSYLDIVIYWAVTPATFLAKKEVRNWPFFGFCAVLLKTLFINRTQKSDLKSVAISFKSAYEKGSGIIVFPEGTSTDGRQVKPFYSGVFEWAACNKIPTYTAKISYKTISGEPSERESVCWWGDMTLIPHIWGLLRLSKIHCILKFGSKAHVAGNRKVLKEETFQSILKL